MNDSASQESPSEAPLYALRNRLAHVLAQAVLQLRPASQVGATGVTAEGFYADFALSAPLSPSDFAAVEARMRELLAHAEAALQIPPDCFALRSLAGAYLHGDAEQAMLTRLYAFAADSRAALQAQIEAHDRAALRDHKKLGRELELFAFDDEIGPGLPLWLPNGTAIRDELEKLMKELEWDAGFERVVTPQIAREALYYRTGHLPYYADSMFPRMQSEHAVFALRPMNCPHHHKLFAARKRSYRELPLRISEYGNVYRYEDSGAVSGLLRTRSMCMNDAHIYCSREQVMAELHAVLDMHEHVYRLLDLQDYRVRLSTRGARGSNKFVEDEGGWHEAEALLRQVLVDKRIAFFEGPGEAAFYGPKIDFQFRMVTGREETASTLQLDFAAAARLELSYVAAGGEQCRPWIIHRAPLGTHERFVALLIERFGGAFPTWLAPIQVRVLPVGSDDEDYARSVSQRLRAARVRADLQASDVSLGKRIRSAAISKIPHVLLVGKREREAGSVTLRRYASPEQETLSWLQFEQRIRGAIETRSLTD
jgi:threonyl-tRNA synthetase